MGTQTAKLIALPHVPAAFVADVAIGLGFAIAATVLRGALDPLLGPKFAFVGVFYGVLGAAWWRGSLAGLVAAAAGMLLSIFLWVEPRGTLTIASGDDVIGAVLFAVASIVISVLGGLRFRAEQAMRESEQRTRALADTLPVLAWVADPDRKRIWFNKVWLDFVGRPLDQEVGEGWIENIHPADTAHRAEAHAILFDAREPFSLEYRLRSRDGTYRWMLDSGRPFHAQGEFVGYIGSCTDITDRKAAEEQVTLVAQEVQHRAKNILSRVKAMLLLTRAETVGDFVKSLDERISAMARADALLLRNQFQGAELEPLIVEVISPYASSTSARIDRQGPKVDLGPHSSEQLSMMLHELATNAVKYGALVQPAGHLKIQWDKAVDGGHLILDWIESGIEVQVDPVKPAGFGTRLVHAVAKTQLGGKLDVQRDNGKLHYHFEIPQASLAR